MKIIYRVAILLMVMLNTGHAQGVVASVTHASYHSPKGSFVDIFVDVLGSSLYPIELDKGKNEARLGVVIVIEGEDGEEYRDSTVLVSPVGHEIADFNHAYRYPLEDGSYSVVVDMYDMYKPDFVLTAKFDVDIQYDVERVTMSDLLLLSGFKAEEGASPYFKSGIRVIPLSFYMCDSAQKQLPFYFEVYGTEDFLGQSFIAKVELFKDTLNGPSVLEFYKRMQPGEVVPVLLVSDISKLSAGFYVLKVDILDKEQNLLVSRHRGFTRLDKGSSESGEPQVILDWVNELSPKELRYSLKAVAPILPGSYNTQINNILRLNDTSSMRKLLAKVWLSLHPKNSEKHYRDYMRVAQRVDAIFKSGFGYGFESDRGRIYLKYGVPSQVIEEPAEPTAFPYEIWIYDKVPDGQTNVKFLFYNPSLASGQFVLLHSNAIGEVSQDKWERILYGKATADPQPRNYLDEKRAADGFMRRAREYFEDN